MQNTRKTILLLVGAIAIFLGPACLSAQEAGKTVAILPFHLNAPPEQQYLTEGLRDILSSRLRAEAGAGIVARNKVQAAMQTAGGELDAIKLAALAEKTGADYLLYGTVTALGGGVSIGVKAYSSDVRQFEGILDFYASAINNDQVMSAIDGLAWDIIEKLFGKQRPAAMEQVQQPQTPVREEQTQPAFTTTHPDKTFMAADGSFALRGNRNFIKTQDVDMELRGFAVGDVDGDGTTELILADKSEVRIFRRDGTRLNLFSMIKMLVRYQIHSVNAADLNGNGRAEIYISASDSATPGSRAVEWDGTGFVDLFTEARWYIKPLDVPGTGLVLAGQAPGPTTVEPGIYILGNDNGTLRKTQRLPVPGGVNLFHFAFADLEGKGRHDIVALDDSFNLRVIRNGSTLWKSEERYGGTKRFIGGDSLMSAGRRDKFAEVDGVGEMYPEIYIPSRILVSDVDNDGSDDIIINRNPETVSTVMQSLIQYPNGTLTGLKWNGLALEELWRTRKIDGYIIDYQAKSLAMESKSETEDELFIGLINDTDSLNPFGSEKSTVVIYPFKFEMHAETN